MLKKKNSTFIVVLVGTDLVFLNQEIESKERDEGAHDNFQENRTATF